MIVIRDCLKFMKETNTILSCDCKDLVDVYIELNHLPIPLSSLI